MRSALCIPMAILALCLVPADLPAYSDAPRTGTWVGTSAASNPRESVTLRVRDRAVTRVDATVNVGCVSGDGEIGAPSRSFSARGLFVRPSKSGLAETKFKSTSEQERYDVTVAVRFLTRERARVRIYVSSVADDPACEGQTRIERVKRHG